MIRDFYRQVRRPSDDVRRGMTRSALFTAAMLLVSCRGGVEADNVDTGISSSGRLPFTAAVTATPATSTAATPAAASSTIGVNVAMTTYYSGEQQYQNLLVGNRWRAPDSTGWPDADPSLFDQAGNIVKMPAGGGFVKLLTPPASVQAGGTATIRCTWQGTGKVNIDGPSRASDVLGDHSWEFRWVTNKPGDYIWMGVSASSAVDPLRNFDCREKGATGLFAPEFVASLKPFGVLRFMDWQQTNENAKVTWATRTLPTDLAQTGTKGVALENIVALTNEVGADAWVNVPWNADAEYVQRMAQLLHDGIPAGRKIYVELSNEVWNPTFVVMHQAAEEGTAAGLAPGDAYKANMLRYAQKTTEVMKVFTRVFADRPGQLVRVASAQTDNVWTSMTIMGYADTANWVDALSVAPYFGADLFNGALANVTDADVLYPAITEKMQAIFKTTVAQAQGVAKQYNKRLIAYEAGQHLLPSATDQEIHIRLNKDQRMYNVYRAYLAAWKAQVGDLIMLYNASGRVWGLRDYQGQPLAETPKRRAALDAIAAK